jgi:four helix bundle protein
MSENHHHSFEELTVWTEARHLRQAVYALTKELPAAEKYVVVPQLRRAALSVTNNIAEGHGRYHYQENVQFLRLARGSLEEILDDLTLCEEQRYSSLEKAQEIRRQIIRVEQLINGYIRYLLAQKSATVHETPAEYLTDTKSLVTHHGSRTTNPQSP